MDSNVSSIHREKALSRGLLSAAVVEIDADHVHGALLRALISSGQTFTLRTITDQYKQLLAHDEEVAGTSIVMFIDLAKVTEQIDSPYKPGTPAFRLDEDAVYRIVESEESGRRMILKVDRVLPGEDDEEATEPAWKGLTLTEEQVPNLIRLFGGILTEVLAGVAGGTVTTGAAIAEIAFDEITASEEEREEIVENIGQIIEISNNVTEQVGEIVMRRLGEMDDE